MLERPVVNLNLTFCLTKDDMDLEGNYLSHTRSAGLEPELTFSATSINCLLLTVTIVKTCKKLACTCVALQYY
jgi:hypothetical protein